MTRRSSIILIIRDTMKRRLGADGLAAAKEASRWRTLDYGC